MPDVAADLKREEDRRTAYRWSTAHAEDLGALVKHMRGLARPVYLVGTSRAAISVVNAANKTKGAEAPDALVVTAGMLVHVTDEQPSAERQSGGFGRITQPTLIVYHQNDG